MGRRGGFQKRIDETFWTRANFAFGALSAGSAAATLISAGTATRNTIMRTRGNLLAYVDGPQGPGGQVSVGIGFIMMPEGQGTTVVTSPLTDSSAPWFWVEYFHLAYEEMVTDVIDIPLAAIFRQVIDSKAMRVFRPEREIQVVVEQATSLGAMSINVSGHARFLLGT